jgi:aryl-alcohol dehydrogenase-like predicted oxidoreductase
MQYRRLGRSDIDVSALCLGTMTFGQQNTESEAHAQLDLALAVGINFIDTAEMYPVPPMAETQGLTETYIGTWLSSRGCRDRVVLATKVAGPGDWLPHIRGGKNRLDRPNIEAAIDASLKRLQTDHGSISISSTGRIAGPISSASSAMTRSTTATACRYWRRSKCWPIWSRPARCVRSAFPTRRPGG